METYKKTTNKPNAVFDVINDDLGYGVVGKTELYKSGNQIKLYKRELCIY